MAKAAVAIPFKEMNVSQKTVFIFKLVVCVATFGMLFPTLGD